MNVNFRNFLPINEDRYSNMIVRTIKIIRNESGYGFTLSRYIVQDEQANQFYQPKVNLNFSINIFQYFFIQKKNL